MLARTSRAGDIDEVLSYSRRAQHWPHSHRAHSKMTSMPLRRTQFIGGTAGAWRVERLERVVGDSLPSAARLAVVDEGYASPQHAWRLQGVASYERYVVRSERDALEAVQPALGRAGATQAALIPIAKSAAWWALPQDERRQIFEESSRHIAVGLRYLPAVARRLYQSRDLGEPFDFLTWFEYAPSDSDAFEELVQALRQTEEWRYVEREIDIRLRYDIATRP